MAVSDPTWSDRQRRYIQRLKARLLEMFGNRCQDCGDTYNLQFAHVMPTGLDGPGRGMRKRLMDVYRNPLHYNLLCKDCHDELDGR